MKTDVTKKYFMAFLICLVLLAGASLYFFDHSVIDGDAISYVDALHTLNGLPLPQGTIEANFAIHRILTTFLGLEAVNILATISGNITIGWLIWDVFMYFVVSIVFYKLLFRMFKTSKTALVGSLFFASNYAIVTAGLGYFMDIGGWFFYILSIYFLYGYIESGQRRDIWLAALSVAVGGFFKENSFVAYVPLFLILLYENRHSTLGFIRKIWLPTLVIAIPTALHHLSVYIAFHHGYLYWVRLNNEAYQYTSRLTEYVKSLGSLLNFLVPVSLAGAVAWCWKSKHATATGLTIGFNKMTVFIFGVLISSIPALMWPGITQRVLFMVVPGLVMVACFFIKKYERYWYLFLPIVALYIFSSFFMDSFILGFINLPF